MHERINSDNLDSLTAVSFSLTSYTRALKPAQKFTTPEEYIADLANALKTYRPAIDTLGTGKESGCITLRFKPLVNSHENELDDSFIDGFHVIHSGPYLLISKEKQKPENKMSEKEAARLLNNIDENRKKYLQQKLQQSGRYQVDKDW